MTTREWLRAKIGPSPNPAAAEQPHRSVDSRTDFFTRYLKRDMRVLHAYSGDGKSTFGLSMSVPLGSVVGVDPDVENLRRARSLRYTAEAGEVSFERCNLDDLPFGAEEFDAVFLDGPFATERSTERALEQVQRVLVFGGLLGARHTVGSSRIFTAAAPVLSEGLARQESTLRDLGGDPDAGLKQPTLLRDAGLINLRVTSSTEQATEDDLLSELTKGGFISPRDESDSASEDEENPQVLSFVTAIETVCWKPV